jgi:hypothetical protein
MKTLKINPLTISQLFKDFWRTISRHGQRLIRLHEPSTRGAIKMSYLNQKEWRYPVPKSICCNIVDIVDYLWVHDDDGFEIPRPAPDLWTISQQLGDVYSWLWDAQGPIYSGYPCICCKAWRTLERIQDFLAYVTMRSKDFEVYLTEPPNPMGRCWASGVVLDYAFNALVFPDHATLPSYELGNSRISKLEIYRRDVNLRVVNFDRGWDIRPDSEELERAVQIVCKRLAKEVFPSYSLRGIRLMVKRFKRFLKKMIAFFNAEYGRFPKRD